MADHQAERFHEFDALRSLAMLMGILFHAAWLFMPQYFYFPYPDAAETEWLSYFFYASHMYRMQLFFLVAGFFACMMIQKRGTRSFIANRLRRIAVPFALFSVVLVPLILYQYNLGGLASGRIQSGESAWELTRAELASTTPSTLLILHLWFLYYLLLLYLVSLIVRSGFRLLPKELNVVGRMLNWFQLLIESGWILPAMVALSTLPMLNSRHWFGIDSPVVGVIPHWQTVFEYWLFFGFGWALFHKRQLLDAMQQGHQWKLSVGILLTIPLYFSWLSLNENGYTTWGYPLAGREQISDYSALAEQLSSETFPNDMQVFDRLPTEMQKFLETNREFTEHQKAGIAESLNSSIILSSSYFADGVGIDLTDQARTLLSLAEAERTFENTMLLNRLALEAILPGILRREERRQPNYWTYRLAFTLTYSTVMWLLVLGLLGAFRKWCREPSALFRYWADGSYWMYLIHINILFSIQYMLGDLTWHWLIKFPIYLAICFLILLPSYHYLVRDTWLGVLLNGRRLGKSSV